MGAAISGLLIMAVFFSSALMMFRTTLFGEVLISNAMKEITRLSGEQARTNITILSASVEGGCTLKVAVKNLGSTSVEEFRQMDVIVQFQGTENTPQGLGYVAAGPVAPGKWAKSLDPVQDGFQPGVLDPQETMIIEAKLSVAATDTGTVLVGTPNGVTTTAPFPQVVPCP